MNTVIVKCINLKSLTRTHIFFLMPRTCCYFQIMCNYSAVIMDVSTRCPCSGAHSMLKLHTFLSPLQGNEIEHSLHTLSLCSPNHEGICLTSSWTFIYRSISSSWCQLCRKKETKKLSQLVYVKSYSSYLVFFMWHSWVVQELHQLYGSG